MKHRHYIVVAAAVVSGSFFSDVLAQMQSRSQGTGAYVAPRAGATVNKGGFPQSPPLNIDLSGIVFSGNNPVALPSVTGGSGSGAVTYTSTTPSVCTVSGNSLTPVAPGACAITVNKAASGVFLSATATATKVISPINQEPLNFAVPSLTFTNGTATLTGATAATGGSGSGAISYASDTPSICTVSGTTVTAVAIGQCAIVATRAGSDAMGPISARAQFAIAAQPQEAINFSLAGLTWSGDTATLPVATGGSGTAQFEYAASGNCSLSGTTLTRTTGTCTVTVTKPASGIYSAATPLTRSISVVASNMANPCTGGKSICNVSITYSGTTTSSTILSGITTATVSFKADPVTVTKACVGITAVGKSLGSAVAVSDNSLNTISGVIGTGGALTNATVKLLSNASCNNYPATNFSNNTSVTNEAWNAAEFVSTLNSEAYSVGFGEVRACNGNKRTYAISPTVSNVNAPAPTLALSPATQTGCALSNGTLTITGANNCNVLATSFQSSNSKNYVHALTSQVSTNWTAGTVANGSITNPWKTGNTPGSYFAIPICPSGGTLGTIAQADAACTNSPNSCRNEFNNQASRGGTDGINIAGTVYPNGWSTIQGTIAYACSTPVTTYTCSP